MMVYLLVLAVSAVVTALLTPVVRRGAVRVGAVAEIRARDVHSTPIPRMGGLAMLLGVGAGLLVASRMEFLAPVFERSPSPWVVLGACALMAGIGVLDDVLGIGAFAKLGGQVLVAGAMALAGVSLFQLPLAGVLLLDPLSLVALSVLAVVVTVNAVNFIDGLDGLAVGVVGIAASAFFVYAYLLERAVSSEDYSLAALLAAVTVGCCLGFWPHNRHPAKIFMGDTGSLLLGLLLAACSISVTTSVDPAVMASEQIAPAFLPILLPAAVLLVPLLDMVLAVVRRTRRGTGFWHADKEHLHHRLLGMGHSHRNAVRVVYAWASLISFGAVSSAFLAPQVAGSVVALAVGLAAILTAAPVIRSRARARVERRARREEGSTLAPSEERPGSGGNTTHEKEDPWAASSASSQRRSTPPSAP